MSSSSSASEPSFPPVVLLVGAQATLRDAARKTLRERVLSGASGDFDEVRFDLATSGTEGAHIVSASRTLPVLAPGRLVWVRGLGDRRAKRFLERDLPAYLEDPVPTTCLALEAERVDRRQRWVRLLQQRGELRDLSPPSRAPQVREWISERIRSAGKRPESGVAAALHEAIGADLDRLSSEVEKLVLWSGERSSITVDDVALLTGQVRALAIWDLTDAIGSGSRGDALRVLRRLLDQGEAPLAILGALSQHFRRLLRAAECQPLRAQTVQKALGMHPFAAEKLVRQLRRFDRRRLLRAMRALRATDAALKGATPLAPDRCLEQLLLVA